MTDEFEFADVLNKKPLYEQIADSIEEAIIYKGEQGNRLPSRARLPARSAIGTLGGPSRSGRYGLRWLFQAAARFTTASTGNSPSSMAALQDAPMP